MQELPLQLFTIFLDFSHHTPCPLFQISDALSSFILQELNPLLSVKDRFPPLVRRDRFFRKAPIYKNLPLCFNEKSGIINSIKFFKVSWSLLRCASPHAPTPPFFLASPSTLRADRFIKKSPR